MITLFLHYRGARQRPYLLLFYYYLAATILLLESSVFISSANNWNYNLLFLATSIVFPLYFRQLFSSAAGKKITAAGMYINILVFIYFDIVKKGFAASYNSYVYATCFLTIVIYTLLYFYELLQHVKEHNILDDFDFWLVCGYLFYFLGCFCIILYYKNATIKQRGDMWIMQNLVLFASALLALKGHTRFLKRKIP